MSNRAGQSHFMKHRDLRNTSLFCGDSCVRAWNREVAREGCVA